MSKFIVKSYWTFNNEKCYTIESLEKELNNYKSKCLEGYSGCLPANQTIEEFIENHLK